MEILDGGPIINRPESDFPNLGKLKLLFGLQILRLPLWRSF